MNKGFSDFYNQLTIGITREVKECPDTYMMSWMILKI